MKFRVITFVAALVRPLRISGSYFGVPASQHANGHFVYLVEIVAVISFTHIPRLKSWLSEKSCIYQAAGRPTGPGPY